MLSHLSIAVADLGRAVAFYDSVLGALGYARMWLEQDAAGYGPSDGSELFAIKLASAPLHAPDARGHIAFVAPTQEAIHRFHAAALAAGGRDDGAPGPRPHYGPHYYAAFVVDPDGYRIEAVHLGERAVARAAST